MGCLLVNYLITWTVVETCIICIALNHIHHQCTDLLHFFPYLAYDLLQFLSILLYSLLPDRKLKTLIQRPLNHIPETKDGNSLLLFWYWEECLKQRFV